MTDLAKEIENIWERRDQLTTGESEVNSVIHEAINLLDTGKERVAEYDNENGVQVNEWLKLAILLLFRQSEMSIQEVGPFEFVDKIPLKKNYSESKVRVVPGASARWGRQRGGRELLLPPRCTSALNTPAGRDSDRDRDRDRDRETLRDS